MENRCPTRSKFLYSLATSTASCFGALATADNHEAQAASESLTTPTIDVDKNESSTQRNPTARISVKRQDFIREALSGVAAGASLTVTKTVVKYPLDTATVRLQMPNSPYSVLEPLKLLDGCYRGIWVPLLTNIPAGAVFFACKDAAKAVLQPSTNLPRWVTTSIAVGVAQFPYWAFRNPSEVVKTRQQAQLDGYGGDTPVWEAYQKVWEDASVANNSSAPAITSFYLGYWENILYAFPADVIKFIVYEQLSGGRKDMPAAQGAVAGAVATAIAQFVTTPLDVVRNRIMAQASKSNSTDVSLSYFSKLVDLGQQEGLSGLFAGAVPRVGKAALSGAIQFATYEATKRNVANMFQK